MSSGKSYSLVGVQDTDKAIKVAVEAIKALIEEDRPEKTRRNKLLKSK